MADETFMVLRVTDEAGRAVLDGVERGPGDARSEPAGLDYRVEAASMSQAQLRELRQDPEVRRVARPIRRGSFPAI